MEAAEIVGRDELEGLTQDELHQQIAAVQLHLQTQDQARAAAQDEIVAAKARQALRRQLESLHDEVDENDYMLQTQVEAPRISLSLSLNLL